MTTVYDVNPNSLIEKAAEALKKEDVNPPEWSKFVKTGAGKQRAPIQDDWWYTRCAAVLRSVYTIGPIGVSRLRTKYGSRKDRGTRSEKFYKGSGSVLRKCLQQLENLGYISKVSYSKKRGREITPKGRSFLDKIASNIKRGAKNESG